MVSVLNLCNSRKSAHHMSRKLFLVRHGETEWNREGRIQGVLDSPLTNEGMIQARRNAGILKSMLVKRLIASPLGRAAKTANIIAEETGARCEFDERLKERDCGTWGGMTWDEAERSHPEIWHARSENPYGFTPPGGESLADLEPRIRTMLAELELGGELALVTHGITMRVLLRCLLELDTREVSRIRCPNNIVYEVTLDAIEAHCQHYLNGEGPYDGLLLSVPGIMSRH